MPIPPFQMVEYQEFLMSKLTLSRLETLVNSTGCRMYLKLFFFLITLRNYLQTVKILTNSGKKNWKLAASVLEEKSQNTQNVKKRALFHGIVQNKLHIFWADSFD